MRRCPENDSSAGLQPVLPRMRGAESTSRQQEEARAGPPGRAFALISCRRLRAQRWPHHGPCVTDIIVFPATCNRRATASSSRSPPLPCPHTDLGRTGDISHADRTRKSRQGGSSDVEHNVSKPKQAAFCKTREWSSRNVLSLTTGVCVLLQVKVWRRPAQSPPMSRQAEEGLGWWSKLLASKHRSWHAPAFTARQFDAWRPCQFSSRRVNLSSRACTASQSFDCKLQPQPSTSTFNLQTPTCCRVHPHLSLSVATPLG